MKLTLSLDAREYEELRAALSLRDAALGIGSIRAAIRAATLPDFLTRPGTPPLLPTEEASELRIARAILLTLTDKVEAAG